MVLAWGLEAKNTGPMPGTIRCEWFKLFLEPHVLRDETAVDPRLPMLPVRPPRPLHPCPTNSKPSPAWKKSG